MAMRYLEYVKPETRHLREGTEDTSVVICLASGIKYKRKTVRYMILVIVLKYSWIICHIHNYETILYEWNGSISFYFRSDVTAVQDQLYVCRGASFNLHIDT